jgi:hypothetical protein
LIISRPDGTNGGGLRQQPLSAIGTSLVVRARGEVIVLENQRIPTSRRPGSNDAVAPDPLADGGQAVALTNRSANTALSTVSLLSLQTGRAIILGAADSAAGDPAALGAFVSVAATTQPGATGPGQPGLVDSSVELRDQGRPSVVLASAAELNQDIHQDPDRPVSLGVFPDHDGGKVAVVLNSLGPGESNSAIVVLDRHGGVVGTIGLGAGPIPYTSLYWSPDNRSLAFSSFDSVGVTLRVVDSRNQVSTQELANPTSVKGCIWDHDSLWLLCLATSPFGNDWVIARNDSSLDPVYSLRAPGTPVLWLP